MIGAMKAKGRQLRKHLRYFGVPVEAKSKTVNAYHCCTHKSASQWVRGVLSDKRIYKCSGLKPFNYYNEWYNGTDPRPLEDRNFSSHFPRNTIATPLYLNYQSYKGIPKYGICKSFFVFRDPRDIVVSWYFYMKSGNYVPSREARKVESRLKEKGKGEGIMYSIDYLSDVGIFRQQESWLNNKSEEDVKVVRFSNITGESSKECFGDIFDYLNIDVEDDVLEELMEDHSFGSKSGGREKGKEDKSSHYRKGKSGDWQNHFDDGIVEKFRREVASLTCLYKSLEWK